MARCAAIPRSWYETRARFFAVSSLCSCQLLDKLLKAVEAALQFGHRSGVRDADMLLGAERFARDHRHERLLEESVGEVKRSVNAVSAQSARDVGIGIKRPLRHVARNSGNAAQPRDHEVAALAVLRQHDRNRILRAAQGFHGGL